MQEGRKSYNLPFTILVYLVGFPLVLACIFIPACSYPTYLMAFKALLGIGIMALIFTFTNCVFKCNPELSFKTWLLGSFLIIICGFLLLLFEMHVFCPNIGRPPYSAQLLQVLHIIIYASTAIVILMGAAYIFYFGIKVFKPKEKKEKQSHQQNDEVEKYIAKRKKRLRSKSRKTK